MKNKDRSNEIGAALKFGSPVLLLGVSCICDANVVAFEINTARSASITSFGGAIRDQQIVAGSFGVGFTNWVTSSSSEGGGGSGSFGGANINNARLVSSSQSINPSTFSGSSSAVPVGTATWGFVGALGNAGTFRTQWSGAGANLNFLDGLLEDSGEAYHVGDTPSLPAPEPGTGILLALGLLAAGANGVRRLRSSGVSTI